MNLTEIMNYVNVVILGICLCVGYMLKNAVSTNKINKFIPLIMGVLGMVLAVVSNVHQISLEVVLIGLFSGLASTGLYETFRNLINKKESE